MDTLTEEDRIVMNVNYRAKRLKQDGYTARRIAPRTVEVSNGKGETYRIDERERTCTCPFFTKWQGKHDCKHLLGYCELIKNNG